MAVRCKDSFARLEQDMHQFAASLPGSGRSEAEPHQTGSLSPSDWQVIHQLVGTSCSLLAEQLLLSCFFASCMHAALAVLSAAIGMQQLRASVA